MTLTTGRRPVADQKPFRWWRVLGGFVAVAALVFAGVAAAGVATARQVAEHEAVNDARHVTDVLAETVVAPVLEDALADGDPAAAARLDPVVRRQLLGDAIVRVKLWTPAGVIVYADEPLLIGRRFPLDAGERTALASPRTSADISDLSRPENSFERAGAGGRMLEVYRPVWTPDGRPLLFETYSRYDVVTVRAAQLWSTFGGVTLISLGVLMIAQAPLVWVLLARVRGSQREREAVLGRAVAASEEDRRRIAATLHDGAVQELAASAYLVAGAADRIRSKGDAATAGQLDVAATSVRTGIGGLRSLLVDIYPPALRGAGLAAALTDQAAPLRARGVDVELDLPARADLPAPAEELIFRVARELVRNVAGHADASGVRISLTVPAGQVGTVLEVSDDGVGFEPARILASPLAGHFGVRLVTDLSDAAGAYLAVRSAPGSGTSWRLEVPR